ncbi:MAG: hypothetical protein WBN60_04390, partial [Polyangiales bacterium]
MRALLAVSVVLAGFAAGASALSMDGASTTEIQNRPLSTTPGAAVDSAGGMEMDDMPGWVSILPPL